MQLKRLHNCWLSNSGFWKDPTFYVLGHLFLSKFICLLATIFYFFRTFNMWVYKFTNSWAAKISSISFKSSHRCWFAGLLAKGMVALCMFYPTFQNNWVGIFGVCFFFNIPNNITILLTNDSVILINSLLYCIKS